MSPAKQTQEVQPARRLSEAEVGLRFQRRLKLLRSTCERFRNSSLFRPTKNGVRGPVVLSYPPWVNVSFSYCPIQKTASSTWKKLAHSIRKNARIQCREDKCERYRKKDEFLGKEKQIKFFFVREPYSRLLSAYVDKLFSPNTLFWKTAGRFIVKYFRHNPSEKSLRCGHDVTFPEFVRYVIYSQTTGRHRDGHFIPTHDHCDVCNEHYDYVGHLETLSEDMPYLLKVIQSPIKPTPDFDKYTIYNNARMVVSSMRYKIQRCITMEEACHRLWKKWQIRGILSKTQSMLLTARQAENISHTDFVTLAMQALARSGPKEVRKQQKEEAMREAFGLIPLGERQQVQNLLLLDFALFGFPSDPEAVFPESSDERVDDYRYFDLQRR